MRFVVLYVLAASASECASYFAYVNEHYMVKTVLSHVYSIIEAMILSSYFIHANRPYHHRKYIFAAIVFWPAVDLLNTSFLQPLKGVNSNIILLESFTFITLSLYTIYALLKNDMVVGLRYNSRFQFSIVSLVMWSCTLFFWATIRILYRNRWPHVHTLMDIQVIINTLAYLAITITLLNSIKKKPIENV